MKEFCHEAGCGLLPFTEQSFEAMHAKFAEFSRYRLPRKPDHPNYGSNLLKITKEMNVRHAK
jgi:hypothetical protein